MRPFVLKTTIVPTHNIHEKRMCNAREHYLNSPSIDDVKRELKIHRLEGGNAFAFSVVTDKKIIRLRNVLKSPEEYQLKLHTINGVQEPLLYVLGIPEYRGRLKNVEVTNLICDKQPMGKECNYILAVGSKQGRLLRHAYMLSSPIPAMPLY